MGLIGIIFSRLISTDKKCVHLIPKIDKSVLKVFDKVRDMGGDWRSKIVPVKGDIAEENLGLSDEDWEMLQESVEIVFHSAATVRFDEDLK